MLEGGKSTVLVLDYIKKRKEIFSNVERRPFVFKVETFPQKKPISVSTGEPMEIHTSQNIKMFSETYLNEPNSS